MYIYVLYIHFLLEREQSDHGKLDYVITFLKHVLKCTLTSRLIMLMIFSRHLYEVNCKIVPKVTEMLLCCTFVCSANVCNFFLILNILKVKY